MSESAGHSQQAKSAPVTASPASSQRTSRAPSSAPGFAFSDLSPESLTPAQVMQMQRAVGNQAVIQLFRSRSGAISGGPPPLPMQPAASAEAAEPESMEVPAAVPVIEDPPAVEAAPAAVPADAPAPAAVPVSAEAPAAIPAPPPARGREAIPIPPDLQGKGGYSTVYKWLKEEAQASKKGDLFSFFDSLTPEQKIAAIQTMTGGDSITVDTVKRKMMTGIFSKSLDWDKFSTIVRGAKSMDTANYNADQDRDYVGYAAVGSSAAAGGVSGSATISQTLGASGAAGTVIGSAPAAAGLSGVSAMSQMYNATQNYDESLSAAGKAQVVAGEGASGAADLARFTAGSVNSVRTVAGMAVNGAATVAAGAGAIVGGAAYMVGGAAGYMEGRRNVKQLGQIEERLGEREGDALVDQQLLAANLAKSTQEMNKSKSGMTAAKGAMMIAGGALLIAAAASPIGPILIALGAILGGVAAIVKFYKKHKRKEAFVDKAFKVDEEAAKPENKGISKDKIRQAIIEKHGFNSVGQCYAQLVTDLAGMLFESGVKGDDKESLEIIQSIGLKVDKEKQTPGKELIAKKLHT